MVAHMFAMPHENNAINMNCTVSNESVINLEKISNIFIFYPFLSNKFGTALESYLTESHPNGIESIV